MGRPIQKKYFANTNYELFGTANVGGESVASVTIAGEFSGFTAATTTVTFSGPDIAGGVTATGTAVIDGSGNVTGVTITNGGSGYTSAPTVTFDDSDVGAEVKTGTATAVLTATRQNGIKCEAQITGGSDNVLGDIIKQVGSKRYKVQTGDGTEICTLVTVEDKGNAQMSIKATDSAGGTYFVKKLTARKVILVPAANVHGGTSSAGTQFASGASAKWTFGSAVLNTTVTIDNQ